MTDDLVITTPVKTFSVQLGSNPEGGILPEPRTKSKQRVSQARTKMSGGKRKRNGQELGKDGYYLLEMATVE